MLLKNVSDKWKQHSGVAIIPEGVVEFVPEFKVLIAEINELLAGNKTEEFNALGSWEEKICIH